MSLEDLEPAEVAGLVAVNGSALIFPHPLARSAAYQAASSQERRAAHRALAEALAPTQLIGRRALHLAAAAVEPNEEVAAELEQAGPTPAAAERAMRRPARSRPQPA